MAAAEITRLRNFPSQINRGAHPHFDVFIAHGEILFPGVVLQIFVRLFSRNPMSRPGIRPCCGRFRRNLREEGRQWQRRAGAAPCNRKTGDRTPLAARDRTDAALCLPQPCQYTPQMPSIASSSTWISSRIRGSSLHVTSVWFSTSMVFSFCSLSHRLRML